MKGRIFLAGAALAAFVGFAGSASASTYLLTSDHCSPPGCGYSNYGTITVSGEGTNVLTVDIDLANNIVFNESGGGPNGHDEIWFNVGQDPAGTVISLGGLASPFLGGLDATPDTANGNQTAGSHAPNGASMGNYQYIIEYKPGNGNPTNFADGINTLSFTVTGSNPLFTPTTIGGVDYYFAVDILAFGTGQEANPTGHVFAVKDTSVITHGGVPEPASWALMIAGFGGVGASLRRRRGVAATA